MCILPGEFQPKFFGPMWNIIMNSCNPLNCCTEFHKTFEYLGLNVQMYIYYQEIPIPLISGNFGPLLEIVMQFVSANTLKLLQGISVDVYDTVKMYIFQVITIPLFSGNFDHFEFRIYVLEAKGCLVFTKFIYRYLSFY